MATDSVVISREVAIDLQILCLGDSDCPQQFGLIFMSDLC